MQDEYVKNEQMIFDEMKKDLLKEGLKSIRKTRGSCCGDLMFQSY